MVGYSWTSDGSTRAFLYSGGVLLDLNNLIVGDAWKLVEAYGINNRGQIVGAGLLNGQLRAFRLDPISISRSEAFELPTTHNPEPASWVLICGGVALLIVQRVRRRLSLTPDRGLIWGARTPRVTFPETPFSVPNRSTLGTYSRRSECYVPLTYNRPEVET